MKGTMQVKNLKKRASYYLSKSYDELYSGEFTIFIQPLLGTEDKYFYYAKRLKNGEIEITGEGYVVTCEESLASHKKDAKKTLGDLCPAYYWLNDDWDVIEKTYQ